MPNEVDNIIAREKGFVNNPADKGGPTKFGITQGTLSWHLGRPATVEDVQNLTIDAAREIYEKRFILGPHFDALDNQGEGVLQLKSNLIDFGVMSGPALAIIHLQEILSIPSDGILGPQTLSALSSANLVLVNKQLVMRRALMAARICKKDPTQLTFLSGWLSRFFSFL